ncbi:hypothetical protein V5O48_013507 [Marasmius crinis-equi]|uniref:Uncharacterized protein n=1 Tax=Marasmius crinis-equi TaxID=585013 RepID=A0ABR3F009_9AGAR
MNQTQDTVEAVIDSNQRPAAGPPELSRAAKEALDVRGFHSGHEFTARLWSNNSLADEITRKCDEYFYRKQLKYRQVKEERERKNQPLSNEELETHLTFAHAAFDRIYRHSRILRAGRHLAEQDYFRLYRVLVKTKLTLRHHRKRIWQLQHVLRAQERKHRGNR